MPRNLPPLAAALGEKPPRVSAAAEKKKPTRWDDEEKHGRVAGKTPAVAGRKDRAHCG